MGDEQQKKKRKTKWNTSYSNMTIAQAEKRLGFEIATIEEVPVEEILGHQNESNEVMGAKGKVYEQIVRYLRIEGNPTGADPDFKEANINHLVFSILSPILEKFVLTTGRDLRLRSEKEIISTDDETGGIEEAVVVVDKITYEEGFILVVEAKRSSMGQALKQCLLALKDMRGNNGKVYGFVTTGKSWQMVEYDGVSFRITEEMIVLFMKMDKNEKRWMSNYSAGWTV